MFASNYAPAGVGGEKGVDLRGLDGRTREAGDEIDAGDVLAAETIVVGDEEIDFSGSGTRELDSIGHLDGSIPADVGIVERCARIKRRDPDFGAVEQRAIPLDGFGVILSHGPDENLTDGQSTGYQVILSRFHSPSELSNDLAKFKSLLEKIDEEIRIPEDDRHRTLLPFATADSRIH